jgi:type IV secretion system protein VirB10
MTDEPNGLTHEPAQAPAPVQPDPPRHEQAEPSEREHTADRGPADNAAADGNNLSPLPGEPGIPNVAAPQRFSFSKKGLLAVVLFLGLVVGLLAFTIRQFAASGGKPDDVDAKLMRDKPMAASTDSHRLEMPAAPAASASSATAGTAGGTGPRIPALLPSADDRAEPIGVRRTGAGAPAPGGTRGAAPEDAPVLLVSSRPGARAAPAGSSPDTVAAGEPSDPNDPIGATSRNLQGYQRQLQGLLDNLTKSANLATDPATGQNPVRMPTGSLFGGHPNGGIGVGMPPNGGPPMGGPGAGGGLFGGQLQGSATPKVAASMLGNRSLTLPKGTAFTCALKTKVISATSGLVGCQVQRNVYSDDGRVLLIERGSHLDGEYRITSVRPGTVRIPVLWTRIRTPLGVTVDVESPGTGQLGESGIDGYVDNRWGERLGAAMLLSLIDDSVKLIIQNQSSLANSDRPGDTIVLPATTANTSKLAEKVLDSTINIPPLIYQNQGGIVGNYVARDVDFSSVYELQPVAR